MILAPLWRPSSRRVIDPRRRRCPVHRRDVLNMALGSRLINASGARIIGANGTFRVSDGTDACPPGGTTYIQAKKCSDNTDADLWFVKNTDGTINTTSGANTALPFYFKLSSVDYYVKSTNNTNTTPGTLASGYTETDFCPFPSTGNCANGTCSLPEKWTATFTGTSICGCRQATFDSTCAYATVSATSMDGTYCLPYTTSYGTTNCHWENGAIGITSQHYQDSGCTDVSNCPIHNWNVHLWVEKSGANWLWKLSAPGFFGQTTTTVCPPTSPLSFTNTYTSSATMCVANSGGSGWGGTATVSFNC